MVQLPLTGDGKHTNNNNGDVGDGLILFNVIIVLPTLYEMLLYYDMIWHAKTNTKVLDCISPYGSSFVIDNLSDMPWYTRHIPLHDALYVTLCMPFPCQNGVLFLFIAFAARRLYNSGPFGEADLEKIWVFHGVPINGGTPKSSI